MSPVTWALLALLLVVVARSLLARQGVVNISSAEVVQRLEAKEKLVVLDVREVGEFKSGHIPEAINVPLSSLAQGAAKLDPKAETVLVCRSGNRSVTAYNQLKKLGFENLKNMPGGMLAWPGKTK